MKTLKRKTIITMLVFLVPVLLLSQTSKVDTSQYYRGDNDYNLIIATERGYITEIERLLKKGANVNAKTWEGVTPLMYAVQNENIESCKLLLENGADPNIKPYNGTPPIIAAVKTENIDLVELLVRSGANINTGDKYGVTPLMYATAFDNYTLADMLIYYDAWINMKDENGNTALIVASYYGCFGLAELLLQYKAQVDISDNKGFTALHVAAQNGYDEIVNLLAENGASYTIENKSGKSPLESALQNTNYSTSQRILTHLNEQDLLLPKKRKLSKLASEIKNDSIKTLLAEFDIEPNRNPNFNVPMLECGMNFSTSDALAGLAVGVYDTKYKLNLSIDYFTRISAVPTLVQLNDREFVQYWERRSVSTITLGKDIEIYQFFYTTLTLRPEIGYGITFGTYKGSYKKPGQTFTFDPGVNLIWKGKNAGFAIHYNYQDLQTYQISKHRFGFDFIFYFKSISNASNNKKVIWYL